MTEPDPAPVPAEISDFLAGHHVMSVAVAAEEQVWAASVFYCWDAADRRLLYYTSLATRHGRLSASCPAVAATVSDQQRNISQLTGIQLEGRTTALKGDDADRARQLFADAFPEVGVADATIWALRPNHMALTDNRAGFGHRCTWSV